MEVRKKPLQNIGLAIALLTASMAPVMAATLRPHIYDRGVHGHLNLAGIESKLTACAQQPFGQLYLGSNQRRNAHFMKNNIVPGGHYGRADLARFQRCPDQRR